MISKQNINDTNKIDKIGKIMLATDKDILNYLKIKKGGDDTD